MSGPTQEFESLREMNPQASQHNDGGIIAVLMPATPLVTPAGVRVMDAVLCPKGMGGYVTRLLIEQQIVGKPNLNWQQVMLLGRAWATWSWNQISPDQPWIRIFAEHARLLR